MQTTNIQQMFNLLAQMQDLLEQATCDGENFAEALQKSASWAVELDNALTTLTDNIEYYVD
jgi:hypothetical protein